MAIIIANEQRSGSIGNTVYSRNKGGSYVRDRAIPTNPNTPRQMTVRTQFQFLSSNWSSIFAADRALWEAYAESHPVLNRLGQPIILSGHAMFLRLNFNILDWGGSYITTPPIETAPDGFTAFSASAATTSTVDISFTNTLGGNERIQLWQSNPHAANSTPNLNQSFFCAWSAAAEVSPWAAPLAVQVPIGQWMTVFGRIFAGNGQWSAFSSARWLMS